MTSRATASQSGPDRLSTGDSAALEPPPRRDAVSQDPAGSQLTRLRAHVATRSVREGETARQEVSRLVMPADVLRASVGGEAERRASAFAKEVPASALDATEVREQERRGRAGAAVSEKGRKERGPCGLLPDQNSRPPAVVALSNGNRESTGLACLAKEARHERGRRKSSECRFSPPLSPAAGSSILAVK